MPPQPMAINWSLLNTSTPRPLARAERDRLVGDHPRGEVRRRGVGQIPREVGCRGGGPAAIRTGLGARSCAGHRPRASGPAVLRRAALSSGRGIDRPPTTRLRRPLAPRHSVRRHRDPRAWWRSMRACRRRAPLLRPRCAVSSRSPPSSPMPTAIWVGPCTDSAPQGSAPGLPSKPCAVSAARLRPRPRGTGPRVPTGTATASTAFGTSTSNTNINGHAAHSGVARARTRQFWLHTGCVRAHATASGRAVAARVPSAGR